MVFHLKNPIILALDIDSKSEVTHLGKVLGPQVGALKVGPRLVVRYGSEIISLLAKSAPVFVDLKFLDIPSTMVSSIHAAFDAGASMATVHGWAGPEALAELAKLEKQLSQRRPFIILVVTILTSFKEDGLPVGLERKPIHDHVVKLVEQAYQCGLRGFVCSPEEITDVKSRFPDTFLVTPGVRFPDDEKGDQKRVMAPDEAYRLGSSGLVIGRPIVASRNPQEALDKYIRAVSVRS